MQETLARVLSKPRTLRGGDELAYLMQVLRNTFFTAHRTASRRPVVAMTLDDMAPADGRPTSQPEQALDVQQLYAAIAALPEDFRLALVAVDIVGLSYREAATSLKAREATLTTRLFRARKQVVKMLEDTQREEETPSRRLAEQRET